MWGPAARRDARPLFFVMKGSVSSRPTTLFKQTRGDGRQGLQGLQGCMPPEGEDLKQVTARVKGDLVGIHPNPGPSEKRYARGWVWWYMWLYVIIWCGRVMCVDLDQSVRSWGKCGVGGGSGERDGEKSLLKDIVTWNVRRMTMREDNRRRLRSVCKRIQRERWEVVLLSELKADENGMV